MTAKLRFESPYSARFKARIATGINAVNGPLDVDLVRNVTVDLPDCQDFAHDGYDCQVKASKVRCH